MPSETDVHCKCVIVIPALSTLVCMMLAFSFSFANRQFPTNFKLSPKAFAMTTPSNSGGQADGDLIWVTHAMASVNIGSCTELKDSPLEVTKASTKELPFSICSIGQGNQRHPKYKVMVDGRIREWWDVPCRKRQCQDAGCFFRHEDYVKPEDVVKCAFFDKQKAKEYAAAVRAHYKSLA